MMFNLFKNRKIEKYKALLQEAIDQEEPKGVTNTLMSYLVDNLSVNSFNSLIEKLLIDIYSKRNDYDINRAYQYHRYMVRKNLFPDIHNKDAQKLAINCIVIALKEIKEPPLKLNFSSDFIYKTYLKETGYIDSKSCGLMNPPPAPPAPPTSMESTKWESCDMNVKQPKMG